MASVVLLVGGCGGEPNQPSSPGTTPSEQGAAEPTSSAAARPVADPPEQFGAEGVAVGPTNVLVGYTAAFALELSDGGDSPGEVVATDLGTGDELWRWTADADVADAGFSDERPPALALSRVDGVERLLFTGVRTIEGEGTQQTTYRLRTVVLDAATGDAVSSAEAVLPTDVDPTGPSGSVQVVSVGVRGGYAVSTVRSSGTLPMTLVADLDAGTAEWAEPGFLASGLGESTAIGLVADDPFFDDGTLRAVALDTRRPLWTGGEVRADTVAVPSPTVVTADVLDENLSTTTRLFDAVTGRQLTALDSSADCLFDERDVVVCAGSESLVGLDAATGRQLWRLPDDAAGRVDPGLDAAFHGRVYAQDVILDARSGKDAVTDLPLTADEVVPGYAVTRETDQAVAYPATS